VDITAAAVTAGSTAGLTFTYFTDAAGTIALATPNAVNASGTYYIKGTTASGCFDVQPVVVTINAKPTVVLTNPAAVCSPGTVDLTAAAVTAGSTAGLTFTYFTDAAGTIALATPNTVNTSGTYYIKGTTASGCSDIQPVTVTINAKPTVAITNPAAVCSPATVDLTAAAVTAGSTAGLTFTYFTDAAGTIALATPNTVNTSGTYYIKGTTASGCSGIQPVTVTINAKPTVAITNPATVCSPATVDITVAAVTAGSTAGLTFTYFTDAAGTIALATPNAVAASGTYYIKGTTASGCSDIQPVIVTINALPTATINYAGSPYCATGTANVTLTGLSGGFFSAPPAVAINGLTGDINLAATTPGSYTVVYTFTNGTCSNTATTLIAINPLPVVAITNPASVCSPATVNLTAAAVTAGSTPGLTLTYFRDAAGTIVLTNPATVTASGTYYIKGTTGSGCSSTKPVIVTINPQPVASIAYTGTPYCTNGTAFVSLTGIGGGSFASTPGLSLNAVTGDINLAASTQGSYLVVYSFTNGTCSNSTSTIVVIKNPSLVINNPAGACSPATIDLTDPSITAGSQAGLTYNYYQDAAGTISVLNPNAVGTAGTYYIQGIDMITGCASAIKPVVVTVFAKPVVSASASATDICKGTTITLTAVSPGNTIDWPGLGAGNVVTATPLDSTVYMAVATSPNGCLDTASVSVAVKPFTLTLTANPDPVLAGTNTVLTTTGNFTYNVLSWAPSIFFANQTATTQNIVVKDTSKSFTVIAQSIDGCLDTATLYVTVDPNLKDFFIPNAFSPNGDGNNDILKVYGSSVRDVTMRIYNQWGELIFETKDINKGWDGTWKGRPQEVGVYVYVAQVTFYNNVTMKRKGTVNLIR
jgi:gliding motility-associated-like protein